MARCYLKSRSFLLQYGLYPRESITHTTHTHIHTTYTHTFLNTKCSLKLSLQIYLSLVKKSSMPQSPAPTTCSPDAANLPRTSTVVMISSLQCFWQVWLSASLPELNSLHSIQSLQEHTQRGRLSIRQKLHELRDSALGKGLPGYWSGGCTSAPQGRSSFRARHLHHKDGFILGFNVSAKQLVEFNESAKDSMKVQSSL